MSAPTWYESASGRRDPTRRPGRRWHPAVQVDQDIMVAPREGVRVHTRQIAPGLVLVATVPAGPDVGADPRAANQAAAAGGGGGGGGGSVDLYTGVANAASGIVTNLGDWIAGWFPRANQIKADKAADAIALAQSIEDAQAERERKAANAAARQQRLLIEQIVAMTRGATAPAPVSLATASGVELVRALPRLAAPEVGCEGVGCIDADPEVGARGPRGGGRAGGGGHRPGQRGQRDQRAPARVVYVPTAPAAACDCGGTCGGC